MKTLIFSLIFLISNICSAQEIKITAVKSFKNCRNDFALKLCKAEPNIYSCFRFSKKGQDYLTWNEIFPNERIRTLAQKINRRNNIIARNHCVVVPDLGKDEMFYSPFPQNINDKEKQIIVDLNILAFGAYKDGKLVFWGPSNGGMGKCKETGRYECKTPVGEHRVLSKSGAITKSSLYPVECENKKICGHPLFWAVQIAKDGTKIHGDKNLPGVNASHGCSRVFREDAEKINNFVELGTKIIVLLYK